MEKGKKRSPVILHLIGWIILFILPQFILFIHTDELSSRFFWRLAPTTLIFAGVFYLHYLVLIPAMINGKKKWLYPIISLAVVVGLFVGMNLLLKTIMPRTGDIQEQVQELRQEKERPDRRGPDPRKMAAYNYFILNALAIGFAYVLRVNEKVRETEKSKKELEEAHLNSELAFLKNQISPHFFFNTLNNIYSLIELDGKSSQEAVLNLSKMMRYLLYESEQQDTTLGDEINFMKNYIGLMKLRVSDKVSVNVRFTEKYNDLKIPPLLFIPFIENAFKHGVSLTDESYIDISLTANNKELMFTSTNPVNLSKGDKPEVASGIGLDNVKKRLKLLMKDRYKLTIDDGDGVFRVLLKIDI